MNLIIQPLFCKKSRSRRLCDTYVVQFLFLEIDINFSCKTIENISILHIVYIFVCLEYNYHYIPL